MPIGIGLTWYPVNMPLAIYSQPFGYFTADVVAKKPLSIFIKPPKNVNKKKELQRQDYHNTKPINFSANLATLKRFTSYNHNFLKRRKKNSKSISKNISKIMSSLGSLAKTTHYKLVNTLPVNPTSRATKDAIEAPYSQLVYAEREK